MSCINTQIPKEFPISLNLPINPSTLVLEAPVPTFSLNTLAVTVSDMTWGQVQISDFESSLPRYGADLLNQYCICNTSMSALLSTQTNEEVAEEFGYLRTSVQNDQSLKFTCSSDICSNSSDKKEFVESQSENPDFNRTSCINQYPHESFTRIDEETGEKCRVYACRYKNCGLEFFNTENFIEHASVHTFKKPYKCSKCLERFAQKGNLKRHMKIHRRTGRSDKKFRCNICHKMYSTKFNMKVHKKTRHNIEES
ncbi:unnamed protein product [Moneuplotes crassus]|uniref:C2H2-type domain-containing protein n=1 Tax=Euplotes crassus TaxID=5936 RepID=A0AAD2D1G0_EUPCR|nr:unnamed protein product [Moneuplotes crassus]